MSGATKRKPWVSNKPEARLSIATDRFLRRALVPPFYVTAIHDSDGGERTMQQRVRDKNRGISKGQLDWDVVQAPGVAYVLRGRCNGPPDLATVMRIVELGGGGARSTYAHSRKFGPTSEHAHYAHRNVDLRRQHAVLCVPQKRQACVRADARVGCDQRDTPLDAA